MTIVRMHHLAHDWLRLMKVDQMEAERSVNEEKLRNLESCVAGSDDKRRIRVLEEDLRTAKEVSVRLHDELERVEERRSRSVSHTLYVY